MDAPNPTPDLPAPQSQSIQAGHPPATLDIQQSSATTPDDTRPGFDSRTGGRNRRNKRKDLGRKAWSRLPSDKRQRNENEQANKRRKAEDGEDIPIYATQFSKEDIEADQRRPKRKVAVLLGYSGTGYHGMQMSTKERTIEGEIFPALVAAGAISKANAMDPKKSSFVRCARTDKGVHAAGNVVSLKLIIEDRDLVQKVNSILSPQIRIWGIEPTSKSFSCYQFCDSRMYEYLIPTHCFLPPHPSTFLAKKILEAAATENDMEAYENRQEEVLSYWEDVDKELIKPLLDTLPEDTRAKVQEALCIRERDSSSKTSGENENPSVNASTLPEASQPQESNADDPESTETGDKAISNIIKTVRAAYFKAKKAYRIHPTRLARVQEALDQYVGTKNFHNYTIQKTFRDPSAKRVIKSFKISKDPIIIDGVEWLSLKVHGQSFMMHQIRKMVAMAALVVRCGTDLQRIAQSYGAQKVPIPKAPGLGLLLERPIFETYNKKAKDLGRDPIDFNKYEEQMEEFKNREIYQRIFREEQETNAFGNFFNHIDIFREDCFLYVTSSGIREPRADMVRIAETGKDKEALAEVESESEDEVVNGGEEGG
ncbi:tRNA pseudouridine synthase 1 [Ophidiomyces ophidiicola]|nr:tRNA pseudouridine synthase 1 [Ophidiomyces ophidiicola]